ncbi:glycosyltransferase family 39 protein [Alicyclobacillus acidiphilus]|uniref:glycosyltransferase family 39 protein n=1 Tax=Alicyclobacillus acidiphilus TaxID=182455 RepID=UPI000B13FCFF|nr:glycosyltransferase family 39 protein [Alicyclobacillus acidiphilus]
MITENRRYSEQKWVWGLLIVALLYNIYFAIRAWQSPVLLIGDAVYYDHSATLLIALHRYTYWSWGPAAQVTPSYPVFLMFAYRIAMFFTSNRQTEMHVAVFIQHIVAAITVVVLYYIMRFRLPVWASLVGCVLWMIYPPVIYGADQLLTETLYVFFLMLFTWSFLRALRLKTVRSFILAGLLLGLMTLVRPSVLPLVFAPLLLLFQRQTREAVRRHIVNWLSYLAVFVVVMLPWWIRNLVAMHQLILTDLDSANPLLFGSDPNFAHDTNLSKGLSQAQQKALALQRIHEGFHNHPWMYLKWYTIDKIGWLFGSPWYDPVLSKNAGLLTRVMFAFAHVHIAWVILGAIGLLISAWLPYFRWISALVAVLVIVQLPFIPINRYVFPLMPFFFLGIMVLVVEGYRYVQDRTGKSALSG